MSRKIISLSFLLLFTVISAQIGASAQTNQTKQEYIDRYKFIAIDHMEKYGIPASITMAQGILESNSGNSPLALRSNNHFGIKCKSGWTGATTYHDDDKRNECFRAYSSVEKSYADHADFLNSSSRYDFLFDLSSTDYKGWAHGLKKAGYATAYNYAELLIKVIEDNDLYILDQKDGAKKYAKNSGGSYVAPIQEGWSNNSSSTSATPKRVDPDNFSATINAHKGYNIYRNNKIFYVEAKRDDTVERIGEFFMITSRRLRSYNDLERDEQITEGERVYIGHKAKRWEERGNSIHTVKYGESIRSISQEYAITVKSLRKLNNLKKRKTLKVGQKIYIK